MATPQPIVVDSTQEQLNPAAKAVTPGRVNGSAAGSNEGVRVAAPVPVSKAQVAPSALPTPLQVDTAPGAAAPSGHYKRPGQRTVSFHASTEHAPTRRSSRQVHRKRVRPRGRGAEEREPCCRNCCIDLDNICRGWECAPLCDCRAPASGRRSCIGCFSPDVLVNAIVGVLRLLVALTAATSVVIHITGYGTAVDVLAPGGTSSTYERMLIAAAWIRGTLGAIAGIVLVIDATVLHHGALGNLAPLPDRTLARWCTPQRLASSLRVPAWLQTPCAPRSWHCCPSVGGWVYGWRLRGEAAEAPLHARWVPVELPPTTVPAGQQSKPRVVMERTAPFEATARSTQSRRCCGSASCGACINIPSRVVFRAMLLLVLAVSPTCCTFEHARRAVAHIAGLSGSNTEWLALLQALPVSLAVAVVVLSQLPWLRWHRWHAAVTCEGGGGSTGLAVAVAQEEAALVRTGRPFPGTYDCCARQKKRRRASGGSDGDGIQDDLSNNQGVCSKAQSLAVTMWRVLAALACIMVSVWHLVVLGVLAGAPATADASFACSLGRAKAHHSLALLLCILLAGVTITHTLLSAGPSWVYWLLFVAAAATAAPSTLVSAVVDNADDLGRLRDAATTISLIACIIAIVGAIVLALVLGYWLWCCCWCLPGCGGTAGRAVWRAACGNCNRCCSTCWFTFKRPTTWCRRCCDGACGVWWARHVLGLAVLAACCMVPLMVGAGVGQHFRVEWHYGDQLRLLNTTAASMAADMDTASAAVTRYLAAPGVPADAAVCTLVTSGVASMNEADTVAEYNSAWSALQDALTVQRAKTMFNLLQAFAPALQRSRSHTAELQRMLAYQQPITLSFGIGALRVGLLLLGPLLTLLFVVFMAFWERTRLRATRWVWRLVATVLLIADAGWLCLLLAWRHWGLAPALSGIGAGVVSGTATALPAWTFLIAAYALATVAAAALGLATYAAPRDLDDAKAIWGVDTGRLRAGTRAPQDERWAGVLDEEEEAAVSMGATPGAALRHGHVGAALDVDDDMQQGPEMQPVLGRVDNGAHIAGMPDTMTGGGPGAGAGAGADPTSGLGASKGPGEYKAAEPAAVRQGVMLAHLNEASSSGHWDNEAARVGVPLPPDARPPDDPLPGLESSPDVELREWHPHARAVHDLSWREHPVVAMFKNRLALMYTPRHALAPWIVHLWFTMVLVLAIVSLSNGYTWWEVATANNDQVVRLQDPQSAWLAQEQARAAIIAERELCDAVPAPANAAVAAVVALPSVAGLVSDTRAFLALMDTLRARPGSGPAWIYTNDGAQFIMAVLILGPALVALVMWLVYWVQHAQDLGDCILCRRRGARYDSLTLHNGTRLQYVPLRPGIHTFVALAAGSAFVSLMGILWWTQALSSTAAAFPLVSAQVLSGRGLDMAIVAQLAILVGVVLALLARAAPTIPPPVVVERADVAGAGETSPSKRRGPRNFKALMLQRA